MATLTREQAVEKAQDYLDSDQLDDAKYPIVGARNLLEEAERIFATLSKPTIVTELLLPWWVYLLLLLFIIVIIVLVYFVFRNRRKKSLVEEMYAAGGEGYSERVTREVKKRNQLKKQIIHAEQDRVGIFSQLFIEYPLPIFRYPGYMIYVRPV